MNEWMNDWLVCQVSWLLLDDDDEDVSTGRIFHKKIYCKERMQISTSNKKYIPYDRRRFRVNRIHQSYKVGWHHHMASHCPSYVRRRQCRYSFLVQRFLRHRHPMVHHRRRPPCTSFPTTSTTMLGHRRFAYQQRLMVWKQQQLPWSRIEWWWKASWCCCGVGDSKTTIVRFCVCVCVCVCVVVCKLNKFDGSAEEQEPISPCQNNRWMRQIFPCVPRREKELQQRWNLIFRDNYENCNYR